MIIFTFIHDVVHVLMVVRWALHRSLAAAVGVLFLALVPALSADELALDAFGGVVPSVAAPTGFFQVTQVGDRWLFVTPEGNGLWMTAVFGAAWGNETHTKAKYGGGADWQDNWRQSTVRRLKLWGFNTLAEYQYWGLRPGSVPGPNPERLPYLHIIKPAAYALDNRFGFGTGPVKDLIGGTDPEYYNGYRNAQSLDFFDPGFEAYVDGYMRGDDGLKYGNIGNAWMLGIAMDDPDTLFGFGPGAEIPAPRLHPHLGWIVLVTNFRQSSSGWVGSYDDPRVYTKYALKDFLASRYGTIEALNAAWGATYTTFDSEGGWGAGTGLLDENGRHPWVGHWADEMATASAAVRTDMSEFLYLYAKRYFTVMATKMREYAPQHLVFGPGALNGWGALTRGEILRAAGENLDVLQVAIGSQQALELTARYAGNRPIVTWDSFVANPDSALSSYPNPEDIAGGTRLAQTQQERGQIYADKVDFLFNAATADGVHAVAGIKFWAWGDHPAERANFGLVTSLDNAYDGREAVRAPGVDSWGHATGGEEGDYGDFVSGVRDAHARVMESLAAMRVADPVMCVEAPGDGAVVPRTVEVRGYAFDAAAPVGAGVDLVRIFQGTTCSGTPLEDATLGVERSDVPAAFALGPTFGATGFVATVRLPARGVQQITVCMRTTATATFAAQQTRTVVARLRPRRLRASAPPSCALPTSAARAAPAR